MADDAGRLREWLAECDEACSECGLELTPRAGAVESAAAPFTATIIGLVLGPGGSGLFAAILQIGFLKYSCSKADVGSIVCIATLAVAVCGAILEQVPTV